MTSGLTVSHVIVARQDRSVSAALPGLQRLDLDLSDDSAVESAGRLFAAWEAAAAFIDGALKAGGRVLIRVHGRSRSASVALAWMVRAHSLPVAMAARILRSHCPSIDWNLAHLETVVEWSRAFEARATICA
jgi:protein-tyrosine phosphatase